MQVKLYFFYFDLLFMHQSCESPTAPHSDLSRGLGVGAFTSDTLQHSMLVPRKVGNSMEVTVFASPTKRISWAVTPWSTVFIFTPHSNFAYYYRRFNCSHFPKRINHYYKHLSVFGITLSQIFLFVIVECTSGPD